MVDKNGWCTFVVLCEIKTGIELNILLFGSEEKKQLDTIVTVTFHI